MSGLKEQTLEVSAYDELKNWLSKNKLKALGLSWATFLGGSLAYQWSRPIPLNLKIIHSRVYAQAFTIAGLAAAGAIAAFEDKHFGKKTEEKTQ